MKQKFLMVMFITISALILGGIITIFFMFYTSTDLKGGLISYQKDDGFSIRSLYDSDSEFAYESNIYCKMPKSITSEIIKYPNYYKVYFIQMKLKNITNHSVHPITVILTRKYDNLWLDSSSIQPGNSIGENKNFEQGIEVIIRTKGLTNAQINELIKGIRIKLVYSNYDTIRNPDGTEKSDLRDFIKRSIIMKFS
jgi:hypothetical protein